MAKGGSVKGKKARPCSPSQATYHFLLANPNPSRHPTTASFVECISGFFSTLQGSTWHRQCAHPPARLSHPPPFSTLPCLWQLPPALCCPLWAPLDPASSSLGPSPFSMTRISLHHYPPKACIGEGRSLSLLHSPHPTIAVCSSQLLWARGTHNSLTSDGSSATQGHL